MYESCRIGCAPERTAPDSPSGKTVRDSYGKDKTIMITNAKTGLRNEVLPFGRDNKENGFYKITYSYDMFHPHPEQREVDWKYFKELEKEILRKNDLHKEPIVVWSDGTIIDGQHRWIFAKKHNVGLFYIIDDSFTLEDARRRSQLNKQWTSRDHIHSLSSKGIDDYQKLEKVLAEFPFITISCALQLAGTGVSGINNKRYVSLRSGELRLPRLDKLVSIANAALAIKPFVKHYNQRNVLYALNKALSVDEYDHQRFIRKLSYQSEKFVRCVTVDETLSLMEKIYNFGESASKRLRITKV